MLTVVTHTRFTRPELLERCKTSVALALPPNCQHAVIECQENWAQARFDAMQLDEYVAFVDDDDTVHPDALRFALDAIQNFNCGLAITDEAMVDIDGNVLRTFQGPKSYMGIANHPRTAHHLCIIRTAMIDSLPLDLHNSFGLGIDWFLKAQAAFRGGAVHIPMIGYNWTQSPESMTKAVDRNFNAQMPEMVKALKESFNVPLGIIPRHTV